MYQPRARIPETPDHAPDVDWGDVNVDLILESCETILLFMVLKINHAIGHGPQVWPPPLSLPRACSFPPFIKE